MKKFPKTIYVERKEENTQDEYLLVHNRFQEAAVVGERTTVAVYELKEVKTVVTTTDLV